MFIANHILTLQNLNFYHTCSEIFKIFKYRNPKSIFEIFKFSARGSKNLFITTPAQGTSRFLAQGGGGLMPPLALPRGAF